MGVFEVCRPQSLHYAQSSTGGRIHKVGEVFEFNRARTLFELIEFPFLSTASPSHKLLANSLYLLPDNLLQESPIERRPSGRRGQFAKNLPPPLLLLRILL